MDTPPASSATYPTDNAATPPIAEPPVAPSLIDDALGKPYADRLRDIVSRWWRTREPRPEVMKASDELLITFLRVQNAHQPFSEPECNGRVLRPREAGFYTGLSEKALWWHRRHGSGPTYLKFGRNCVGYRVDDLNAWLLARAVHPDQETGSAKRAPKGA
jgi:hypothetical protein